MRAVFDKKWPGAQYIAYFQAGTNTMPQWMCCKVFFEPVLAFPDVVGLAVATRADCLPEPVLDYLADLFPPHRPDGRAGGYRPSTMKPPGGLGGDMTTKPFCADIGR